MRLLTVGGNEGCFSAVGFARSARPDLTGGFWRLTLPRPATARREFSTHPTPSVKAKSRRWRALLHSAKEGFLSAQNPPENPRF